MYTRNQEYPRRRGLDAARYQYDSPSPSRAHTNVHGHAFPRPYQPLQGSSYGVPPGYNPQEVQAVRQSRMMAFFTMNEQNQISAGAASSSHQMRVASTQQEQVKRNQFIPYVSPNALNNTAQKAMPIKPASQPIHPGYKIKPKSATAVTPSGETVDIPIDESMYAIKGKSPSPQKPSSRHVQLLESETLSLSPHRPGSGRPFSRRSDSDEYSDNSSENSSDSNWPGDNEASDSDFSDNGASQNFSQASRGDVSYSDFDSDDLEAREMAVAEETSAIQPVPDVNVLKSIENYIYGLVQIDHTAAHQNNSALHSQSSESNESVDKNNEPKNCPTYTNDSNCESAVPSRQRLSEKLQKPTTLSGDTQPTDQTSAQHTSYPDREQSPVHDETETSSDELRKLTALMCDDNSQPQFSSDAIQKPTTLNGDFSIIQKRPANKRYLRAKALHRLDSSKQNSDSPPSTPTKEVVTASCRDVPTTPPIPTPSLKDLSVKHLDNLKDDMDVPSIAKTQAVASLSEHQDVLCEKSDKSEADQDTHDIESFLRKLCGTRKLDSGIPAAHEPKSNIHKQETETTIQEDPIIGDFAHVETVAKFQEPMYDTEKKTVEMLQDSGILETVAEFQEPLDDTSKKTEETLQDAVTMACQFLASTPPTMPVTGTIEDILPHESMVDSSHSKIETTSSSSSVDDFLKTVQNKDNYEESEPKKVSDSILINTPNDFEINTGEPPIDTSEPTQTAEDDIVLTSTPKKVEIDNSVAEEDIVLTTTPKKVEIDNSVAEEDIVLASMPKNVEIDNSVSPLTAEADSLLRSTHKNVEIDNSVPPVTTEDDIVLTSTPKKVEIENRVPTRDGILTSTPKKVEKVKSEPSFTTEEDIVLTSTPKELETDNSVSSVTTDSILTSTLKKLEIDNTISPVTADSILTRNKMETGNSVPSATTDSILTSTPKQVEIVNSVPSPTTDSILTSTTKKVEIDNSEPPLMPEAESILTSTPKKMETDNSVPSPTTDSILTSTPKKVEIDTSVPPPGYPTMTVNEVTVAAPVTQEHSEDVGRGTTSFEFVAAAENSVQYIYAPPVTSGVQYIQSIIVDEYGYTHSVHVPVTPTTAISTSPIMSPAMSPVYYIDGEAYLHDESEPKEEKPVQSDLPKYTHFIHDAFPANSSFIDPNALIPHSLQGDVVMATDVAGYSENSFSASCSANQPIAPMYPDLSVAEFVEIGNTPGATDDGILVMAASPRQNSVTSSCYNESEHMTDAALRAFYDNGGDLTAFPPTMPPFSNEQMMLTDAQMPGFIDPADGLPYPALHVTDDGLMTVILRMGVFLEMTPEKSIRLVNHEKKLVVAMNENGGRTCVIHPSARINQSDTTVHSELFFGRKSKMTTNMIMFGNKRNTYKFDYDSVTEVQGIPAFRDLSQDESIHFLETNNGFFNSEMVQRCHDIMARAYFQKHQTNGSKVIINGAKVVQNDNGDVSVYLGPIKFIRMSPSKSILRLKSQFIEVDIEANWNVKVTRGSHALNASHLGFIVTNGKIKASLDSNSKFQAFSLPDHRPLFLGQQRQRRRAGTNQKRRHNPEPPKPEPAHDHAAYDVTSRPNTMDDAIIAAGRPIARTSGSNIAVTSGTTSDTNVVDWANAVNDPTANSGRNAHSVSSGAKENGHERIWK